MNMSRMVANVVVEWEKMAGESPEVRKLNSLLTHEFIGTHDFPADECLTEARELLAFWLSDEGTWKAKATAYLVSQFGEATNLKGHRMAAPKGYDAVCAGVVDRAERVLRGGNWPDRPVSV